MFRDCNFHIGGVDLTDIRTYMFLDKRGTIQWNKKVFFILFCGLVFNAFILHESNTSEQAKLPVSNL